jgi:hypothetical protein
MEATIQTQPRIPPTNSNPQVSLSVPFAMFPQDAQRLLAGARATPTGKAAFERVEVKMQVIRALAYLNE